MCRQLDFDQIFPMDGPESARLMALKAECLARSGLITEAELLIVTARASRILHACESGLPSLGSTGGTLANTPAHCAEGKLNI